MGKKVILLLLVCFAFTLSVNAQGPPPPPPPPPPGLPIDGGVILLLISGVYYGVKKLKK